MKLLIIEDEKKLSDSIVDYLSSEQYLCEQAFTFQEALLKVRVYDYDCILLDLMLPGGDGIDILKEIRGRHNLGRCHHRLCKGFSGRQDKRLGNWC